MTVYDILHEPIKLLGSDEEKKRAREIIEHVFAQVGLKRELLSRYPHSFSGGQRQRISMARSLVLHPELVVADEPVSALDVSIQAQILNLFKELQRDFGLTYVFISHDLAVIRYVCDRIAVMYLGSMVEIGETEKVLSAPMHPYTQLLINSIPKGDGSLFSTPLAEGEIPDPIHLPSGCSFHTRCPRCTQVCLSVEPELVDSSDGRQIKCHNPIIEGKKD
jgi:oligopeptide/dipeptide ABC transporter ATP-binding protein